MNRVDLTRWNRAQLSRFRYLDGNAATHLEDLRLELAERFQQWNALKYDAPHDETNAERAARMLAQYHADRRDWAWETTRAFARALHVLTEHIDAFANEGYLRTATQWQSMRRLAGMVDYTPAPASSATTPLVLIAHDDVTTATVKRGLAVTHVPAGAPPVIFETLEDIDIASALNALQLKNWDQNTQPLFRSDPSSAEALHWPVLEAIRTGAGGLAMLADAGSAAAIPVRVTLVKEGKAITLEVLSSSDASRPVLSGLTFGTALLHVSPLHMLVPRVNGGDVVQVSSQHNLAVGDVVAWKAGASVQFAAVIEAASGAVRLQLAPDVKEFPTAKTDLFRAAPISFEQFTANNSEWRLRSDMARSGDFRVTFAGPDGALNAALAESQLAIDKPTTPNDPKVELGYIRLTTATLSSTRQIWFADPGKDRPVAAVGANPLDKRTLEFDGKPPALAVGDFVILQSTRGNATTYVGNRIAGIEGDAGSYRLVLATDLDIAAAVTAVHASFTATLRPKDCDLDTTPVAGNPLKLQLDPNADCWTLLRRNRLLVLDSASGAFAPFMARIVSADPKQASIQIDLPIPELADIRRGDLIIRANVVDAGHGETKPVQVLGSGDASATNQNFRIEVDDVSHLRDAAMPGGLRADLLVEAEHEIYSQVATFRDSGPGDPHYLVRITDAGTFELEFGDGRHGRRLPSGTNNVLATTRRGSGLAGNLPALALTDVSKKHPAVDSILQPIAATGGDDREAIDEIRQNAPRRLIAMDRAISISDYQHLAEQFQGVWHAAASEQTDIRPNRAGVRIVIVPAGGGPLGVLEGQIRSYLLANGLPSIDIFIEPFVALPVEITVRARVDATRFDQTEVEGRVRAAILALFDLRRRGLGQPVYRSEVTRVVEHTVGVLNSDVVLFETTEGGLQSQWDHAAHGREAAIWAVFPKDNQVIYAAKPALVTVTTAEAST